MPYSANQWYKVDILLDWGLENSALFLDGEFIANTQFYSAERDR